VRDDMLVLHAEQDLNRHLDQSARMVGEALGVENFDRAMGALASLRPTIDEFFARVTVNDKDTAFRENRLHLLSRIRATMNEVADFSQIEG
jgi:glycyl-tRNA synthetase beta chain